MTTRKRVAIAAVVAAGALVLVSQINNDDSSKGGTTTGGSSQVKPSEVRQIIVDADSATTCNKNSPDVIDVKASDLAAGEYSVALADFDTGELVDEVHQVTVGANGKLSDAFRCAGQSAGQYKVTVTSEIGDSQGSDAVDVYPDRK